MIQTDIEKYRSCSTDYLSQPPKSGAMIQTFGGLLKPMAKAMSQPPKSGAMIQTNEIDYDIEGLINVSTP